MYQLLDGKKLAENIKNQLKIEINNLSKINISPCLAVILVGENLSSKIYIKNKVNDCKEIGIEFKIYNFKESATEKEIIDLIVMLNKDISVNGILVQMPLPKSIDPVKIILAINPEKDVDGFHPYNIGLNNIDVDSLLPCTAAGVLEILKKNEIQIEGKHCVVLGRSNVVGKPVSQLLLKENATVTMCHSKTKNLKSICLKGDILIVAVGQPYFIKVDMVKENSVIIDVGINKDENGKLVGDVDFHNVKEKVSYITPVPGGIGPMTRAMLLKNCIKVCNIQIKKEL